jgi:hypothetical protein
MVQAANLLTFDARLPSEAPEFGIYRAHGLCGGVYSHAPAQHDRTCELCTIALDAQWGGIGIRLPVYIDNVPFIRTDFILAKPTPRTRGT